MEAHFDEYQLAVRNRVAFRALLLTLTLILVNGWISTMHVWASPLLQAAALVMLPSAYFVTAASLRGAYLSRRERHPALSAALFLLAGAVYLAVGLMNFAAGEPLVRAGQLCDRAAPLLLAPFFLYVGAVLLLRLRRDRRAERQDC